MAGKVKVKKKSKLVSKLIKLAVAVFLCYALIMLISDSVEIRDYKKQLSDLKQKQESQTLSNEELREVLEADDPTEYIERIAKSKLNLVYASEQVYYVIPEEDNDNGNAAVNE